MRLWIIAGIFALGAAVAVPSPGGAQRDVSDKGSDTDRKPAGDAELDKRTLPWSYFQAVAEQDDVLVIDVREGFRPRKLPGVLATARPIPLDIFLANFVARKANQDKTLLIFDESGSELSTLHAELEAAGYDNYFFLAGGLENTLRIFDRGS